MTNAPCQIGQVNGRRVALLTYGTRGDVEPFLALGTALRSAGYAVRLAAPSPFAPLAAAQGIEFAAIQGDPDQLAQSFADQAGLSWPKMVVSMAGHVLPLAEAAFRTVEQAAQDADLIVHSFLMTDAGHTLAHRMGIPDISAQFFPMFLPTAAFPAVAMPDLPLGGLYRRGTHAFATAIFRYGARALYRVVRARAAGLPDLGPWLLGKESGANTPLLFAYSPQVLPRPADWPACAQVTGYWQLPPPAGWTPAQELARFLDTGAPPIYFGPGSMRTAKIHSHLRAVVTAARACGQRLLLGVPPQWVETDLRGADVFAAPGIPHAWLFPRMGFILHHGGAGTTGAAAAAGIPSSAIPFSADQAFWARQLHRLGVGPAAPSARHLNRDRVEAVFKAAIGNLDYRRRAEALGQAVRGEDGAAAALDVINRLLAV